MGRNNRPLRYGAKRTFKLREEYDDVLVEIAAEKHTTPGTLAREIVERSLRRRCGKDNAAKKDAKSKRYQKAQQEFLTQ